MWTAVFQMKEIGEFSTAPEAFKAIYDAIHEEMKTGPLSVLLLETATWIVAEGSGNHIYFNEARDMMCDLGYLVNGKWIDITTTNPDGK